MRYTFLQITIQAKIATITINRPEVLNALKFEVLGELRDAMLTLRDDEDVKVVVITGAGPKAFVAGADVAVMAELGSLEARKYIMAGHETFDLIASFPKPVVAAVNGFALGGGCELALSCDFIYAAEHARFGLPEITLGIIPGWGGTQRLPQRIGIGLAKEMIYSGKVIDAAEAKAIGLVNKLFPAEGFLDAVKEELNSIISKSIVPLTMAKAAVNAYLDGGEAAGKAMEIQSVCICFSAQDQKEGMAAFLQKRKPEFLDK